MTNKPTYFSILPAEIRYNKELSNGAKLLYSEIMALSNKYGECMATNGYLSEAFETNNRTITRWLTQLKDKEFITVVNGKEKGLRKITPIIQIGKTKMSRGVDKNVQEGVDKNVQHNNINNNNNKYNNKKGVLHTPKKGEQFDKIFDYYNTHLSELPTAMSKTGMRKSAVAARLKDYDYQTIIDVLDKVKQSDFLTGKVRDWRANFDWIFRPTNFVKILEGNYNNKPKKKQDYEDKIKNMYK